GGGERGRAGARAVEERGEGQERQDEQCEPGQGPPLRAPDRGRVLARPGVSRSVRMRVRNLAGARRRGNHGARIGDPGSIPGRAVPYALDMGTTRFGLGLSTLLALALTDTPVRAGDPTF